LCDGQFFPHCVARYSAPNWGDVGGALGPASARRFEIISSRQPPPIRRLKFPQFCAIFNACSADWLSAWRINTLLPATHAEAAHQPLHPVQGLAEPETGALLRTVLTSLDDSKAEDIVAIDLHGKTTLADVMIIASGRSNIHVGAIAERVIGAFKGERHKKPPRVEGLRNCDWVLVDGADIIVHIFRPEVRQFYNLEKMWSIDRPGERRLG
jgi:ribosome-associated protein